MGQLTRSIPTPIEAVLDAAPVFRLGAGRQLLGHRIDATLAFTVMWNKTVIIPPTSSSRAESGESWHGVIGMNNPCYAPHRIPSPAHRGGHQPRAFGPRSWWGKLSFHR